MPSGRFRHQRLLAQQRVTIKNTQTSTFLAACTAAPAGKRQLLIDRVYSILLQNGTLARLDLLYLLAAHESLGSRLNWKSPGTFTLALVDAPTFTVDRGWQGDGVNDALDTVWDPTNNPGNFLRNDSLIALGSNTDAQSATVDAGSAGCLITVRSTSDQYNLRVNDGSGSNKANAKGIGRFISQRTGSNAAEAFRNGVSLGTSAVASIAVPSTDFRWLGRSNSNSFGIRQQWFGALGGSLTSQQISDFDYAMATWQAGLGF